MKELPNGAGYLHILEHREPTVWKSAQAQKQRVFLNPTHCAHECFYAGWKIDTEWRMQKLAFELGVSEDSLRRLMAGYHIMKQSYSFPMRDSDGSIIGIRYRPMNGGRKFTSSDSRNGLVFDPSMLSRDLVLIVEGASDCAAMMTLCPRACVIGRSDAMGNTSQIKSLLRRAQPRAVLIIPDTDPSGIGLRGARQLLMQVRNIAPSAVVEIPTSHKDVREAINTGHSAQLLIAMGMAVENELKIQ